MEILIKTIFAEVILLSSSFGLCIPYFNYNSRQVPRKIFIFGPAVKRQNFPGFDDSCLEMHSACARIPNSIVHNLFC